MIDPNDFLQSTKDVLSRRAGSKCSNPSCGKPTSGPHSDDGKAVNLGEAAHIRGARLGSARFDCAMTPEERRSIINGIWLCRACARLIDLDERRYTVEILFRWKREHEMALSISLAAESGEREVRDSLLRTYGNESPAALQLVLDKPEFWEHLLTVELIREKLKPIRVSLTELEDGVVYQSLEAVPLSGLPAWVIERTREATSLVDILGKIVTERIPASWGPLGEPGYPAQILHSANLLRDACLGLLSWECKIARTIFPDDFEDLLVRMRGWTHGMFSQMETLPAQILAPLQSRTPGEHVISIVFEVPDGAEAIGRELSQRFDRALR